MPRDALSRLLRAGFLTALIDGAFSSVLSIWFYDSSATRLFQGVASTVMGKDAFTGGTPAALIGVLMHIGVAFGWSTVFLILMSRLHWIRRILASPYGVLRVAAVYGPCIWLVMSLLIVPQLLHRPPTITIRWWIQLIGHFPFVGLPIVAVLGSGMSGGEVDQNLMSKWTAEFRKRRR